MVRVGERTTCSTGNPIRVPLPGGGTFECSTFIATYPDGREYAGMGVQPDYEIHPTREEIYHGVDAILEKGGEVIAAWGKDQPSKGE